MKRVLQILGGGCLLMPAFLYWLLHGNYDRYLAVINGPFPFSHLGSGPFFLLVSLLFLLVGIILLAVSFVGKK